MCASDVSAFRVVSLFTGAAGLDLGLHAAGAETVEMCESWEPARRILAAHFPDTKVSRDVRDFSPSQPYEVLTAGFPCTDLSHAGGKAGIFGAQSGLVEHAFRIAETTGPTWIVLENVPNLLHLHRGLGIKTVTARLEQLGYQWAYRTLDSRFTGVAQRRNRVIVLASKTYDPAPPLLGQDTGQADQTFVAADGAHGFYWTEGRHGLGLISGAIPTLKGGSTIGLPSAPAVWLPDAEIGHRIMLPSLAAGERLQGFETGWTTAAKVEGEHDPRWKIVGNAVTTGVGAWIGRRLAPGAPVGAWRASPIATERPWPSAASGGPGRHPEGAEVSKWPERQPMQSLSELVDDDWTPLSHRATYGFLSRVDESGRELDARFAADLEAHLSAVRKPVVTGSGTPVDRLEAAVRALLDEAGDTYLLRVRPISHIPHRSTIVVPGSKVAVDIRTCYWHGCRDHVDARLDSMERWRAKRVRVTARDRDMESMLTAQGWSVEVLWAHDRIAETARHVATVVAGRRIRARGAEPSPAEPLAPSPTRRAGRLA